MSHELSTDSRLIQVKRDLAPVKAALEYLATDHGLTHSQKNGVALFALHQINLSYSSLLFLDSATVTANIPYNEPDDLPF